VPKVKNPTSAAMMRVNVTRMRGADHRARRLYRAGASETVVGLTESFKPLPKHRGLYVPNPQRGVRVVIDALPRLRLAATGAVR